MASITNNSRKYGEGHKVVLRSSLSAPVQRLYTSNGYKLGTSIFSIVLNPNNISSIIQYSSGSTDMFIKDERGRVVQLIGSPSAIDGTFNHYSTNSKSQTNVLTEVKENISMFMFEGFIEKKVTLSEDQIIEKLGTQKQYFDSTYYESAVKQLNELKGYITTNGFHYERQGGIKTKKLYDVARKLTRKASDNWNPADVWMIKKSYDMTPLYNSTESQQLNGMLAEAFYKREVIPISLKNVTTAKASSSIIDPQKLLNMDLTLDLSYSKVDLSDTFANFILQTISGFAVRVGYKASATTLNVSLEGRMISAGYQLGAVDAKAYQNEVSTTYRYQLRNGVSVPFTEMTTAKKELKEIVDRYGRFSNTLTDYDQAMNKLDESDELTKKRFINLISYMYSLMIVPPDFKKHMKFCYFTAKKITNDSGLYLILQ